MVVVPVQGTKRNLMSLPEFPTDDYVLDLLLDSMSGVYQIGEDGDPYFTEEFSLNRLLEFFLGTAKKM